MSNLVWLWTAAPAAVPSGSHDQFCRVGYIVKCEEGSVLGGPFVPVSGQIHSGFGSLDLFQVVMRAAFDPPRLGALISDGVGSAVAIWRIALVFNRARVIRNRLIQL